MSQLDQLETKLDELLNKKAPMQLPPNGRKGLARAMWWIALVFGVLDLLWAYGFWHIGHAVDRGVDVINSISAYYGGPTAVVAPHLGFFYYLTIVTMALVGVLFLVATPKLKEMQKAGWNILYYAVLVQAVVAVARLFSNVSGGIANFLGAAVGAVVAAYFLFQIRDYFTGARVATSTAAPKDEAAHEHKAGHHDEHRAKHEAKK